MVSAKTTQRLGRAESGQRAVPRLSPWASKTCYAFAPKVAKEEHNRLLLDAIEKITLANRERALALRREAEAIANQAGYLRSKLEYEMAKKKLRKHCDLVRFF